MRLYRASQTAGPQIRADMRRHLKDAAGIGASAAKARARMVSGGFVGSSFTSAGRQVSQHGRHGRHGGGAGRRKLGSVLASNIRVQVKGDDIRIVQGSAGISGRNAAGLPRGLDEFGGFTHPTFGHDPVVEQSGQPYFARTMTEKRGEMIREVSRVLDDIERHLT